MNLLIIPHMRVTNANAFSSPFSIGFPAMTAWLGAVHAMERRLKGDWPDLMFRSVGIISHKADLQVYRGRGDYVYSIINTANPVDKDGKRPSFIEEPRIHLEVSLIIEIDGVRKIKEKDFFKDLGSILMGRMKMASGDIESFKEPSIQRDLTSRALMRHVGPGYAIIQRRDLLTDAMEEGMDALEGMIEYLSVHHTCEETDGEVQWQTQRKTPGWIVPVAIGFHGLTPPGHAKNQRDSETPHRFAESVVTLGEFRMPHRLESLEEMLWEYRYDVVKNLYLCETKTTKQGVNYGN